MRYLLSLLLAGATGCSSLWGGLAVDTAESCNLIGCPSGGVCNPSSGLCEGGSVGDLAGGGGDMGTVKSPVYFSMEKSIYSDSSRANFNLALADIDGSSSIDIALSGAILTGGFEALYNVSFNPSPPSQTIPTLTRALYLTNYPTPGVNVPQLLVACNDSVYYYNKPKTNPIPSILSTAGLDGYKLISVGYIDTDSYADLVVTATAADFAQPAFGLSKGNGKYQIFSGAANGTITATGGVVAPGGKVLSLAAASPQAPPPGFNLGLSGANDVSPYVTKSATPANAVATAKLPLPTDFSIPVDVDGNSTVDLINVKVLGVASNSIIISSNTTNNSAPDFITDMYQLGSTEGIISFRLFDFDQDGKIDIGISQYNTKTFQIFHNESTPGKTKFSAAYSYTSTNKLIPRDLGFADIDGDGCVDLALLLGGDLGANGTEVVLVRGHYHGDIECP
jgi:hypothetical protein